MSALQSSSTPSFNINVSDMFGDNKFTLTVYPTTTVKSLLDLCMPIIAQNLPYRPYVSPNDPSSTDQIFVLSNDENPQEGISSLSQKVTYKGYTPSYVETASRDFLFLPVSTFAAKGQVRWVPYTKTSWSTLER